MANTTADQFEAYFKRADLDGDGRISGSEAVSFFQASGLPKSVLAQVWNYADQRKAGFLGRDEFFNALKLVTVAQSKRELTPDIVKAALYSPASAKIPPPQINLATLPPPAAGAGAGTAPPAASQMPLATSLAPQSMAARPPLMPGNVSINQQYFPSQGNQVMGPPQARPPTSVSNPQQVLTGQALPTGSSLAPPRPPSSNVSNNWLGGGRSGPIMQTPSTGTTPVTQTGFGMTSSGFTPPVQARPPPATTGQVASTPPKPHEAVVSSIQPASKDSKPVGISGNGFASDSLFGDVFSATPAQPQGGSPAASASTTTSSIPASPATVSSPVGPQPSVKPGALVPTVSIFSQQPVVSQISAKQNQQGAAQSTTGPPPNGFPAGAGNSATSQPQTPWPKMTQSDIQKYVKVFVQVDIDRDGRITGEQARNLFLHWRLPREVLKQVWDLSDQDNDSMLSIREFCIALYLMERYREGHPLPPTLPSTVISDETLVTATSYSTASYGSGSWGPASGLRPPQVVPGTRPAPAGAAKPPRPRPAPHADEKQPIQQKPKVPVLEKHLVDQLSQEEQDALNSKFQEASQADKKVDKLEKEIMDSRQKIEFYRAKMQELIIYKSRCDNRLNEVTARVSADKREAEVLAKKYEEKYKQSGDVASKLTIEEATFRDIQERKMELYRAIVKMEEGGTADGVLKERAKHIQSGLEELVKTVNERCKQYGLRAKPTSLVELPFGWQPGIQEGAADLDEDWDKFEDEGFTFVKELTLDVQNVVAPPKPKISMRKETALTEGDPNTEGKPDIAGRDDSITGKASAHEQIEDGVASPSGSPASRTESHAHEFRESPLRESIDAHSSPRSNVGHAESVFSGDKSVDEASWGKFDAHYDTDSLWGFDSKDSDRDRDDANSLFGFGEFSINPIKTGASLGKSPLFDSVPSTPAYDQGKISFDSVPSTPGYNPGKTFLFADSVPGTPAYSNQGKSLYAFADSVPSTPVYNRGHSSGAFADSVPSTPAYSVGRFEGPEDHSFDSFSRFDSFGTHEGGLFQSQGPSLARFDSMSSNRGSDHGYGFPSRFDSFSETRDSDQGLVFSQFDSFKDSEPGQGFSRFDSFRDSEIGRFDSSRERGDNDQNRGFSRFDSFTSHDGASFQYPSDSLGKFDSSSGSHFDRSHRFSSFDENDPFGSGGPFKSSLDSETPRKSTENWRAF